MGISIHHHVQNLLDDDVEVVCSDGRSFIASEAVIVTVPLSVLNDGDIDFGGFDLPGSVNGNPLRPWWKGYKYFI